MGRRPPHRYRKHERRAHVRAACARAGTAVELACACALVFAACSVDDRRLGPHPGLVFIEEGGEGGAVDPSAGTGGASIAGSGASGGDAGGASATGGQAGRGEFGGSGQGAGGATAGSSGTGGAAGSAGDSTWPCPDLDGNGVPDCRETVLQNAAFDADTSGWSSETNASLEWVSDDAGGAATSGSLGVSDTLEVTEDGSLMVGAHQCHAVDGATVYRFIAQISVPDEAPDTRGGFQLTLFDAPKCTGTTLDTRTSQLTQGSAWQLADMTYLTPTVAKSVSVRLVSIKPFVQPAVTVLFDNVLMHPDAD